MPSNTHNVTLLFLAGGFTSGIVTCVLIELTMLGQWIGLLGVGGILAIAVGACVLLARARGWLVRGPSLRRYVVFSLIATLSYPLNIIVMFWGSTWFCNLCRLLAPTAWEQHFRARCHDGDPFLGLWLAAIGAAVLVACGLRLLTGIWDGQAMSLLVIGGIGTVAAVEAYPHLGTTYAVLRHYINDTSLLFVMGDAIFGTLCGYWLARANRQEYLQGFGSLREGDRE